MVRGYRVHARRFRLPTSSWIGVYVEYTDSNFDNIFCSRVYIVFSVYDAFYLA